MTKRPPVSATAERHMRAETIYDLTEVPGRSGPLWTHEFHEDADGTRVVETVRQDVASPLPIRLLQRRAGVTDRSADLAASMAITLERLDAVLTNHHTHESSTPWNT